MKKKLKCILLIDDNPDDNFMHKHVINKMDVAENIEVALNGEEGITYLTEKAVQPPELIFLDINMPKMNGWEFLDEYKGLPQEQRAKVVLLMLTTSVNPEDRSRAERIKELTGFEVKPLVREKLQAILEEHFAEYL